MRFLPVDLASAPISTHGIDKNIQPAPATIDRICAFLAVFWDKTRWKYSWNKVLRINYIDETYWYSTKQYICKYN